MDISKTQNSKTFDSEDSNLISKEDNCDLDSAKENNKMATAEEIEESPLSAVIFNKLEKGDYKSAVKIIKKKKYTNYITHNSLEIVPVISRILEEKFCTLDTEKCIEQLLVYIASVANSKEALLVFLEEMEVFRSEKQFRVFLKPLQTILSKEVSNKAKSSIFSWVFNSLYSHISVYPLPSNYNLEGDERKLLECDSNVQNLSEVLKSLVEFYTEFYDKIMKGTLVLGEQSNSREYLSLFLLQYFHKPLSFLDIYCENDELDMCSSIYETTMKLVGMIVSLLSNPFKLLNYIKPVLSSKDSKRSSENRVEPEIEDQSVVESLSQLSISCFFYCIIGQRMSAPVLPCVYAPEYLYLSCLPCCVNLLNEKEELAIHKGLIMLKNLLCQLNNEALNVNSIEAPNHVCLVKSLINVMVFCDNKGLRMESLEQFRIFLWKFEGPGRLKFINIILSTVTHPGVVGVVIHELKESIAKSMSDIKKLDNSLGGTNLTKALLIACSLPEGEKTDLLELSDKIMASLNLILFLCIRDVQNTTKYKDLLPSLCGDFMEPLQRGLRISKGHYELKLKELNDTSCKTEQSVEISLINGDKSGCPSLPPQQEKQVIETSLNWLDIMLSVWARVDKLINNVM